MTSTYEPRHARVFATYSDGCFCARPKLAVSVKTEFEPTFQFWRAAADLVKILGAENLRSNRRSAGHNAWAELPFACEHRSSQGLRITYEIIERQDHETDHLQDAQCIDRAPKPRDARAAPPRGRKDCSDWFIRAWRDSRRCQDIACRIVVRQFETTEARKRLGHLLHTGD